MGKKSDAKIDRLRHIEMFQNANKSQLRALSATTDVVDLPAGRVLCRQSRSATELFVILSGEVTVERDGRELARLGPGELVGELGVIDQAPRSATVVTRGPVELLAISARSFRPLLEMVPGMSHGVMSTLSRRIREADAVLANG